MATLTLASKILPASKLGRRLWPSISLTYAQGGAHFNGHEGSVDTCARIEHAACFSGCQQRRGNHRTRVKGQEERQEGTMKKKKKKKKKADDEADGRVRQEEMA